jgi:hypothetical protein
MKKSAEHSLGQIWVKGCVFQAVVSWQRPTSEAGGSKPLPSGRQAVHDLLQNEIYSLGPFHTRTGTHLKSPTTQSDRASSESTDLAPLPRLTGAQQLVVMEDPDMSQRQVCKFGIPFKRSKPHRPGAFPGVAHYRVDVRETRIRHGDRSHCSAQMAITVHPTLYPFRPRGTQSRRLSQQYRPLTTQGKVL